MNNSSTCPRDFYYKSKSSIWISESNSAVNSVIVACGNNCDSSELKIWLCNSARFYKICESFDSCDAFLSI